MNKPFLPGLTPDSPPMLDRRGLLDPRGLPSQPDKLTGLLGNPLLMASLGLFSAGRDNRIDPYQAALSGVMQAQQFKDARENQEMKRDELEQRKELLKVQIDRLSAPTTRQRDWEYAQGLPPAERELFLTGGRGRDLQRIEFLEHLYQTDPEAYNRALIGLRAPNMVDMGGGGTGRFDAASGGVSPVVSPQEATDRNADAAAASAQAAAIAKAQGEAQAKLPGMALEVEATKDFIAQLKRHPGREQATGKSSLLNQVMIVGDTRDFLTLLDTAKGKAFAIAYETLKGGGTITEVETEMATKALTNLETAQSEGQFLAALNEFERAVDRGYEKLKATAGQSDGWGIVRGD